MNDFFDRCYTWKVRCVTGKLCIQSVITGKIKIEKLIFHSIQHPIEYPFHSIPAHPSKNWTTGVCISLDRNLQTHAWEQLYTVNIGYRVSFFNNFRWWCASWFFSMKKMCRRSKKFEKHCFKQHWFIRLAFQDASFSLQESPNFPD